MAEERIVHRVCTLCEATCGITVRTENDRITDLRGDKDDPFSQGFICPKAYGLKALQEDPDRLNEPLRRTRGGSFEKVSWESALGEAVERLNAVRAEHGANAIATYLGNPTAHSLHAMVYGPVLQRALGTQQRYSASSVDQLPKMVSAGLMFGGGLTIPVPDLDRTNHLLILGGNPAVSNGSLMTAPNAPGRLRKIRERGGKVVVVDPRRSETAELASEHVFIRPGTDALLLFSMLQVLFAEGRVRLGRAQGLVRGQAEIESLVAPFSPEKVAGACGIPADVIRRITREFSDAPAAACYGRIGTTCQEFGTLASWGVDLVNVLTGNLDRAGGAMFTRPAANRGGNRAPGSRGRGVLLGRTRTRVQGLPEMFGEFPVAALADEILTPGDGRIRAMITLAGNPVLSNPGSATLDRALASLDFMVSVDFYLNETTRHANVILPPPPPLERDTYDLALYQLAVRDVAKYSPAVLSRATGRPDEWEILLTLAKGLLGMASMDLDAADDFVIGQIAEGEIGKNGGNFPGLTKEEALSKLAGRRGPARVVDLLLRTGPHGDGFGRRPGLSLDTLVAAPHGVDLGPLKEQLPDVLRTTDGLIDLAPALLVADVPRLAARLDRPAPDTLLIGRRHLRSNNSWMHNLEALVKGPDRCTLLVNPEDAKRLGLSPGGRARVTSEAGSVVAPIEITDEMMPGVVSLPHGWGHDVAGTRQENARRHAGVNVNVVSDRRAIDPVSGNAALNGVPVRVEPAA